MNYLIFFFNFMKKRLFKIIYSDKLIHSNFTRKFIIHYSVKISKNLKIQCNQLPVFSITKIKVNPSR